MLKTRQNRTIPIPAKCTRKVGLCALKETAHSVLQASESLLAIQLWTECATRQEVGSLFSLQALHEVWPLERILVALESSRLCVFGECVYI